MAKSKGQSRFNHSNFLEIYYKKYCSIKCVEPSKGEGTKTPKQNDDHHAAAPPKGNAAHQIYQEGDVQKTKSTKVELLLMQNNSRHWKNNNKLNII